MEQFNLANYKEDILGIAKTNSVTPVAALQLFVENLVTMREHYTGAVTEINYHALGQDWNVLLSKEKVKQKDSMVSILSMTARSNPRSSGKE